MVSDSSLDDRALSVMTVILYIKALFTVCCFSCAANCLTS